MNQGIDINEKIKEAFLENISKHPDIPHEVSAVIGERVKSGGLMTSASVEEAILKGIETSDKTSKT